MTDWVEFILSKCLLCRASSASAMSTKHSSSAAIFSAANFQVVSLHLKERYKSQSMAATSTLAQAHWHMIEPQQ